MNGLLNDETVTQNTHNTQKPPQQGNSADIADNAEGNQQMYDVVAGQMLSVLYSEGFNENLMAGLQNQSVDQVIEDTVSKLFVLFTDMVGEQGKEVPPKLMLMAGVEVSKAIGELAQETGAQVNPEQIESGYFRGLQQFAKMAQAMPDQTRQAYAGAVDQMLQMRQQSGKGDSDVGKNDVGRGSSRGNGTGNPVMEGEGAAKEGRNTRKTQGQY